MPGPRDTLNTLVERYDPEVLDPPPTRARVRLEVADRGAWDALLEPGRERLTEAVGEADAELCADAETWRRVASDLRGGMDAFRAGRLRVRRDLHLGVGLLAATSGMTDEGRLTFRRQSTDIGDIALLEAGVGGPVVMLPGLRGTKAAVLPSVAAPAD